MDFPTLDFSPSALSLSACILLCAYLTWVCTTPPNPPPPAPTSSSPTHHDSLQSTHLISISLYLRHIFLLLFYTPTVLLILFPGPSRTHCLSPGSLNRSLLSWSPATTSFIASIFLAAPIRLRAFAQLGLDFNFRLSEPRRLVTGGLYGWVQHPSYTALWVMSVATYFFALRGDGVAACVLPEWTLGVPGISGWGPAVVAVVTTVGMGVRVREEEKMLRDVFGAEWDNYHGRTKRFLPGLF